MSNCHACARSILFMVYLFCTESALLSGNRAYLVFRRGRYRIDPPPPLLAVRRSSKNNKTLFILFCKIQALPAPCCSSAPSFSLIFQEQKTGLIYQAWFIRPNLLGFYCLKFKLIMVHTETCHENKIKNPPAQTNKGDLLTNNKSHPLLRGGRRQPSGRRSDYTAGGTVPESHRTCIPIKLPSAQTNLSLVVPTIADGWKKSQPAIWMELCLKNDTLIVFVKLLCLLSGTTHFLPILFSFSRLRFSGPCRRV
jgi:hypothetical protein